MIALALTCYRRDVSLVLIEQNSHFGGDRLEAGLAAEIPLSIWPFIENACVKSWQRCFIAYPSDSRSFDEAVVLVDPRQLHIDIIDALAAGSYYLNSRTVAIHDKLITHSHGEFSAEIIIDASDVRVENHLGIERKTSYRDFNLSHDLDVPILADMSLGGGDWAFLQLFPIDNERIVVEQFRPADDCHSQNMQSITGIPENSSLVPIWQAIGPEERPETFGLSSVHFPLMLQVAADMADGFAKLPNYKSTTVRKFFASKMNSSKRQTRDMFEFVKLINGASRAV